MRDLVNNIKTGLGLAPQVVTADQDGVSIDVRGFDSLAIVVALGAAGDTLAADTKFDFKLQHAEDNGAGSPDSWEAVGSDDVLYQTVDANGVFLTVDADAEAGQAYRVGYKGSRRWVRVQTDVTGTHENGTPVAVIAVQGDAHIKPVS